MTYGKHVFNIFTEEINSANLPVLQVGSRILFEFKDSAGTVIFSDIISNYSNNKYVGYVWIKGDPLRTYDDIQQGAGTMTIVAKNQTTDFNWRNRYNVRITFPFQIDLYTEDTEAQTITYTKNPSPIYFQYPLASMGSGSGLSMSQSMFEVVEDDNPTPVQHNQLIVSASRLRTYSGKVDAAKLWFKLKRTGGSSDSLSESEGFTFLDTHTLTHDSRSKFESQIGLNYAQGINTLSDEWAVDLTAMENELDGQQEPYVKFMLTFEPPNQEWYDNGPATDIFTGNEVRLVYPLGADNWMSIQQGERSMANTTYRSMDKSNKIVVETNAGAYSYRSGYISIGPNQEGIKYDGDGIPVKWGPDQELCVTENCGDPVSE